MGAGTAVVGAGVVGTCGNVGSSAGVGPEVIGATVGCGGAVVGAGTDVEGAGVVGTCGNVGSSAGVGPEVIGATVGCGGAVVGAGTDVEGAAVVGPVVGPTGSPMVGAFVEGARVGGSIGSVGISDVGVMFGGKDGGKVVGADEGDVVGFRKEHGKRSERFSEACFRLVLTATDEPSRTHAFRRTSRRL